jgi:cystathionine beta-lyase
VIKAEGVKILLLSHPHNPSGRVWKEEEVKSMVRICKKYDVVIVSDEILADLTLMSRGIKFYSLAREFPNYSKIIIANSISKAFNYSSLQGGYAFTADRHLY